MAALVRTLRRSSELCVARQTSALSGVGLRMPSDHILSRAPQLPTAFHSNSGVQRPTGSAVYCLSAR